MIAAPPSALDPGGSDGLATRPRDGLQISESAILVVDDIEWNRVLIGGLLAGAGFTNVRFAADGRETLIQVEANAPDLLVLDIMMPGIDGYEVCRRLRADPRYSDIPILVQTALTGSEDRNRAFAAGTTDLISKPIDRQELVARVRIHLENRFLVRRLQQFRSRLEGELATARAVFEHILPQPADLEELEAASGFRVGAQMIRTSDLGGDIWGLQRVADGKVAVFLLDMSGRGVMAALNACRLHTLILDQLDRFDRPHELMAALSDAANQFLDPGQYGKMILGVIDPVACTFEYATAATTPPIVWRRGLGARFGGTGGLPLGAARGIAYEPRSIPFDPGNTLLLLSNAVFDAVTAKDDGHTEIARLLADSSADQDFTGAASALAGVVGPAPADDHTAVWIGWPEGGRRT